MIENTKCECGHQNHVGSVLCEACGKPLAEALAEGPLEMRYDGVARRSQRGEKSIVDRIWSFFSSVRTAIYLILATLVGASFGTIFPQEDTFIGNMDPSVYYEQTYGTPGKIYYLLGLSHTYTSWWFLGLLLLIGTSLVICSLDRVLPLYRALSKQQIRKHRQFIERQRVVYDGQLPQGMTAEEWLSKLEQGLRGKRYRVYREHDALLAEKNRFSRWGPYVNHIGLIIFLLTLVIRSFPGMTMDHYISILEGETKPIPGTAYYLKNEQFTLEVYSEEELRGALKEQKATIPKKYQTDAVLYVCEQNCDQPGQEPILREVHRHAIVLNAPLEYGGISAYQFDYDVTPRIVSVKVYVTSKQTGEAFGPIELRTSNPKSEYEAGPYKLLLRDYFPEFGLSEQGYPITKSREPNAPAYIFLVQGPGLSSAGETFIYFPREVDKLQYRQDQLNAVIAGKLDIKAKGMEDVEIAAYTTMLNIRKDTVVPFLFVGGILFMIGVAMGLYWHHRRIWLRVDDGVVLLGAHTNKNWYGLRHDTAYALRQAGVEVEPKSLQRYMD